VKSVSDPRYGLTMAPTCVVAPAPIARNVATAIDFFMGRPSGLVALDETLADASVYC
jgi:hypothetical protein